MLNVAETLAPRGMGEPASMHGPRKVGALLSRSRVRAMHTSGEDDDAEYLGNGGVAGDWYQPGATTGGAAASIRMVAFNAGGVGSSGGATAEPPQPSWRQQAVRAGLVSAGSCNGSGNGAGAAGNGYMGAPTIEDTLIERANMLAQRADDAVASSSAGRLREGLPLLSPHGAGDSGDADDCGAGGSARRGSAGRKRGSAGRRRGGSAGRARASAGATGRLTESTQRRNGGSVGAAGRLMGQAAVEELKKRIRGPALEQRQQAAYDRAAAQHGLGGSSSGGMGVGGSGSTWGYYPSATAKQQTTITSGSALSGRSNALRATATSSDPPASTLSTSAAMSQFKRMSCDTGGGARYFSTMRIQSNATTLVIVRVMHLNELMDPSVVYRWRAP